MRPFREQAHAPALPGQVSEETFSIANDLPFSDKFRESLIPLVDSRICPGSAGRPATRPSRQIAWPPRSSLAENLGLGLQENERAAQPEAKDAPPVRGRGRPRKDTQAHWCEPTRQTLLGGRGADVIGQRTLRCMIIPYSEPRRQSVSLSRVTVGNGLFALSKFLALGGVSGCVLRWEPASPIPQCDPVERRG